MDIWHPYCWWCLTDLFHADEAEERRMTCTTPLFESMEACLCEDCRRKVLFPVRCYFLLPERPQEEYKLFRSLTDKERIRYVQDHNLIEKGEKQAEEYFKKIQGEIDKE